MSERLQIWGMFLAPLLLVAALIGFGMTIPVPELGRAYVQRISLPDAETRIDLLPIAGPQDASRPLVVIDAGHGGHDPGTNGGGILEKTLVLSLARRVRDQLVEGVQGFRDRGDRARAVDLVEVDPVGVQPAQAGLDRAADVAP